MAEVKIVEDLEAAVSPFAEIGSYGLKRASGYVDEEFLPQLRGRKAVQVFKEMSQNDPLVGAMLHSITMLLRNIEWTVKPGGKGKQDTEIAKLVETSMHDMEQPWSDFITEVLTMLVYGWSWHEIVYKRRGGPYEKNPRLQSKHSDGLIAWRKMPIRAQETLVRWVFDDGGSTVGMVQLPPPAYRQVTIPRERSLLFRYKHHKGNPEGVSMLRNAYRPWYMKKRMEEFEAIGMERDLAGLPVVKIPAQFLRAKPGTEQHKAVGEFRKMIKSLRRNEQEGLVFPIAYDQDTKQPLYSLELLGGGGGRQFNTDAIIQRYEQRILMSVLADFIMVGHQSVGSYSLHTDKTGIFRNSLNAIAQSIADVLNRSAVPKLIRLNGWQPEEMPEITPTDVDAPDIAQLAQFMQSMAAMGVQWFPDADMEKFVRDAARLPQQTEDAEEQERKMSEMQQAINFAQKQAEYVQSRMAVQQAMDPQAQQTQMDQARGVQPQQPGAPGQQQPGQPQQKQQQDAKAGEK
jgi:hypothetical protein